MARDMIHTKARSFDGMLRRWDSKEEARKGGQKGSSRETRTPLWRSARNVSSIPKRDAGPERASLIMRLHVVGRHFRRHVHREVAPHPP